ncbi:DUF3341 domain-containing protein [Roseomonas sp. OT10]|uniref:DUF3341 domain-containing protein n=1 Tax=Roseomonas cutis TaxID=2897332 RepID=UPI001E2F0AD4|nr:DUF3341 domain-containing protein [Roseomonas sp. OT10]UFN49990.1 DUF3341 domain-containing protein [Roseomonas sp. OT10]
MSAAPPGPAGLVAEFTAPGPMLEALREARAAGWTHLDAYAPYPVPEAAELLGVRGHPIGWIALANGVLGFAATYAIQFWLSAVDYPINVGGRPLHAWPAFLVTALTIGILWAAVATLVGMLVLNRLPRLHHPIFGVPGFERAGQDRFLLCLFAEDPLFRGDAAERLLRRHAPRLLLPVPAA